MTLLRRAGIAAIGLSLFLTVGCAPATGSHPLAPGFGASDVDVIQVYTYSFGRDPKGVRLTELHDRREIARWALYLTDLPVTPARPDPAQINGAATDGLRFQLRDGSSFEITQLFLGPKHNLLILPDGTALDTDYGAPSGYTSGTEVDPGERPSAVVP